MNEIKLISGAVLFFFGLLFLVGFSTMENLTLYGNTEAITGCVISLLVGIGLLVKSKI